MVSQEEKNGMSGNKQTMYLKVSTLHRPMLLCVADAPNLKLEMFMKSTLIQLGKQDDEYYTVQPHIDGDGVHIGIRQGLRTSSEVAEPLIDAQPNVTMESGYMITYYTDGGGIITEICGRANVDGKSQPLRVL